MSELSSGNQDVAAHLQGCGRLGLRSGVGGWGRGQVWEHTLEGAEAGVEVRSGGARPSCGLCSPCRWLSSPWSSHGLSS